ncbi:MAG: TIGR00268 family protein, partial [Bacteroidota bacterium]
MQHTQKLVHLQNYIRQFPNALVAFSGGIDSAFLLKIARDVLGKENVLAVTAVSASLPQKEKEQTIETAT